MSKSINCILSRLHCRGHITSEEYKTLKAAVEKRQGTWLDVDISLIKCSECYNTIDRSNISFYCPNCGASMKILRN